MSEPPIAVTLKLDERALPAEEFEHVSARAGLIAERRVKREEALENFGKPGRDEVAFGSLFAGIAKRAGWMPHMKLAQLRHDWASIVGDVIARNRWAPSTTVCSPSTRSRRHGPPSSRSCYPSCARRCSSVSMASTSTTFASPVRSRMGPPHVASNMCGRTCITGHSDPTRTACAAKNQEIRYKRAKNTSPPIRVESLVE